MKSKCKGPEAGQGCCSRDGKGAWELGWTRRGRGLAVRSERRRIDHLGVTGLCENVGVSPTWEVMPFSA